MKSVEGLYQRVAEIIEQAQAQAARSVNTAMVQAYWLVGRELIEHEQGGKRRASYGEQLIQKLARDLSRDFGKGFNETGLKRMRQFYLAFPKGSSLPAAAPSPAALPSSTGKARKGAPLRHQSRSVPTFPPSLSWTHYRLLLTVRDPSARSFYEIEAAREAWSARELERQVGALLFERLASSRSKEQVLALARQGQRVERPTDVLKDPMVLEFLGLKERAAWLERDLEQALIDRLEEFLLELGKGFCFVARQKRLTLDGDHFYIDLVFYNRLLRCFVLIDLKLGKLTHQDLGQMQMYVNYFDQHLRADHEEPTVGIVLCSDKNDAMVKITLPQESQRVLAARYQLYLPSEEELRKELSREREAAERELKLSTPPASPRWLTGPVASKGVLSAAHGGGRSGQNPRLPISAGAPGERESRRNGLKRPPVPRR